MRKLENREGELAAAFRASLAERVLIALEEIEKLPVELRYPLPSSLLEPEVDEEHCMARA